MSAKIEIVVENMRDGDTFPYSVIVIKGFINSSTKYDSIQITSNSEITLLVCGCVNNMFTALIELRPDQNVIELYCDKITKRLVLFYRHELKTNTVLPLYIICEGHEGNFQAPRTENNGIESALNRISTVVKLVQCIIGEKMREMGLERKTAHFEDSQVFHSRLNYKQARSMTQNELWESVGKELAESHLGRADRKFLAFLSCTKYHGENYTESSCKSPEDLIRLSQAYVTLGGGGLALLGSACMHTWPENVSQSISRLCDQRKIDRREFFDASFYEGTFGACFSSNLGSTLHELCHIFDLGHTNKGIMGNGFADNARKFFIPNNIPVGAKEATLQKYVRNDCDFWTKSSLLLLYYHKWFNNNNTTGELIYEKERRLIKSALGLRVIELRNIDDEYVLKSWIFEKMVLKFSFQMPPDAFVDVNAPQVLLVVEDNSGNILKEKITHQ